MSSRDKAQHPLSPPANEILSAFSPQRDLQKLVEYSHDHIALADESGKIIYSNRAVEDLVGYTTEEYIGLNIADMLHPDELSYITTVLLDLLKAPGKTVSIELRVRHKQGHYVWLESTLTNLLHDPNMRALVSNSRSISPRKQAEAVEREQHLLAKAMRDSLAALTASLDVNQVLRQILDYAATVVSYDAGCVILFEDNAGRVVYWRGFAPEADDFISRYRISLESTKYKNIYLHKQPYLIPDTHMSSDWVTVPASQWIRSSIGIPIEIRGSVIGALIINSANPHHFQDTDVEKLRSFARYAALALENAYHVTHLEEKVEARSAELSDVKERVEVILNNSLDGILLVDSHLQIQQANPAFNKLFESAVDSYAGQPFLTLIHPDDKDRVADQIQTAISTGIGAHIETRASRADGTFYEAELSIGCITPLNKTFAGLVCTIRDITDRKNREQQLRYYANLQQNVSDAVIVTDMQYYAQSWNLAAEVIYGWKSDEILGKSIPETLKTRFEDPGERNRAVQGLLQDGFWQGEVFQQRRDGVERYILGSITLIRDENGNPISIVAVNHDITERKNTERQLKAKYDEELQFQQYLRVLHDISIELTQIDDLDEFYKHAVQSGLDRLGFDRIGLLLYDADQSLAIGTYGTDALGKIIPEHQVRFDPTSLTGILERAFHEEQRFAFDESAELYAAGRLLGIGWNAVSVLWNGTERLGWLAVDNAVNYKPATKAQLDILVLYSLTLGTLLVQKKTQLALQMSENRYRLLTNNIRDMVARSTISGKFLYVSPSCYDILGYTPEEMLGHVGFSYVHPDDHPEVKQVQSRVRLQPEVFIPFTMRYRHKHGHYVWLEVSGQALLSPETGKVIEFITTSRDVSERKQTEEALHESEKRFRSVIEAAPDYILLVDPQGHILMANSVALRDSGYSSEEMVGHHLAEFFVQHNGTHFETHFMNMLEHGTSRHEEEFIRKDGSTLNMDCSTSIIYDEKHQPQSVIVVQHDITAHKQTEDALRQAFQKEKELSELKSRFVSMASHEFRTPLTTILSSSEMLMRYRERMDADQMNRKLNGITEQVQYLANIIEELLDLERMQSGHFELKLSSLDLDTLCRDIIEEFQGRPEITHELVYDSAQVAIMLTVDKRLMRQIIINLITNAIKYSPQAQQVHINLATIDQRVLLQVSDQGIGIPPADLEHLFEPFHRAANVGTISGTGLGLSITRQAVEMQGGTIAVESHINVGTTFSVTLPFPES